MVSHKSQKKYLTPKEFSREYGFSTGTLANWRMQRKGPPYYLVGRNVFYNRKDIERWIRNNPVLTINCRELCG